jgi:hypothetical protein
VHGVFFLITSPFDILAAPLEGHQYGNPPDFRQAGQIIGFDPRLIAQMPLTSGLS